MVERSAVKTYWLSVGDSDKLVIAIVGDSSFSLYSTAFIGGSNYFYL